MNEGFINELLVKLGIRIKEIQMKNIIALVFVLCIFHNYSHAQLLVDKNKWTYDMAGVGL